MPITLDKLFSLTVSSSFEYLGETVNVVWSPSRYTGEMDELAATIDAEQEAAAAELEELSEAGPGDQKVQRIAAQIQARDRKAVRRFLAALLVSWDVLDARGKPIPTDERTLATLPPDFLTTVFASIGRENQVDPTKAPGSRSSSSGKARTARSPRGTASSGGPTTSGSRRGT